MGRAIVVEANEIPPRVVDWWIEHTPTTPLRALRESGTYVHTRLEETLPRDLYPSQSWASVGMGAPWAEHGVFWYGDPKPATHRFYWQRAADAGKTVGLVGVLHSSPVAQQCAHPNFRFVIPDVFSDDPTTIPAKLEPIQALNLRLTRQSARVASTAFSFDDVRTVGSFVRNGVRPTTFARLGALAAGVATKRANKERLRVGQVILMGDVFEHLVEEHDPDLAVFFTNHVASAMHRYWAATFPQDWDSHPYGDAWIEAYKDELPFAMRALDDLLRRLLDLGERTEREVLIVSSMGQHADTDVDPSETHQAVVRDPQHFLDALACPVEVVDYRPVMVPQLSASFVDSSAAQAFESWLRERLGNAIADTLVADEVVTATVHLTCDEHAVLIGDERLAPESIGASIESVSDHRSGRHHPVGVLLSSARSEWPDEVDALSIGDRILDRFTTGSPLTKI